MMIHPTAILDPKAEVHDSVQVGPYSIIDAGVTIGPDSILGPHVYLTGQTTIGKGNNFHSGTVIGDQPQDVKYNGEPTCLCIGDENIFREHVTIHRSNTPEDDTVIGSNNFFMVNCHVGHNSIIGNHNTFANGVLIAGHVEIADRAFFSGNCLVHQFVRIGSLALMQGGSAITQDLPPFTVSHGLNGLCGLNTVGLRRMGFTPEQTQELKLLYKRLFREGEQMTVIVEQLKTESPSEQACELLDFIAASKRGVCRHLNRKDVDN